MQLEQSADHSDVTDVGDVAQSAGSAAEQRRDHCLRYEVLRTADPDLTLERGSAVDKQDIVVDGHESRVPWSRAVDVGKTIGRPLVREPKRHEPKSKRNGRPPHFSKPEDLSDTS
ncbi:hypothetical protein GCM10023083_79570 [Streptomyces phyllanthi]